MKKLFLLPAAMLLVFSCTKNHPPATPVLSGPTTGNAGDTLTFTFSTTDPENQELEYTVAWGDTSAVERSAGHASGLQVTRTHVYSDSGMYHVKVMALDIQQAESEWSDSAAVSIVSLPPHQPGRPSGPVSCTTGIAYTFTAQTNHPQADSVWFQFDWGGAVGNWGGPVASDSEFREQHVFDSAGAFSVMVRARDARGGTSEWSEPLEVTVVRGEPTVKPDVSYEVISTGAYLRLSWSAVDRAESYEIRVDDSIYTTASLSFDVATPTATIEVRAVSRGGKSDPATINCGVVESTIDVYGDLDNTHSNGFGFATNGHADTCMLRYPSYLSMDFYADGFSFAPEMRLFSARMLNFNRRGNGIKAASGSYDEAKLADPPGTYADPSPAIAASGTYYLRMSADTTGTWSTADNFAKTNVILIDGYKVTLKTAYQMIGGLRWLKSD